MAQFDLYQLKYDSGWFLSVQSDYLNDVRSTVLVPLRPRLGLPVHARRLNPILIVNGSEYVFLAQSLAAVSNELLIPTNISLAAERYRIIAALDFLFTGV